MCVQCVANGAPYVAGSLVALKAMGLQARRRRLRPAPTPSDQVGSPSEAPAADPAS